MNTVYITGASAGLGRAIAKAYADAGYRVGLIARDAAALADAAQSCGNQCAWAAADVADFAQLQAAADKICRELGPPDIWINNAMATIFSRFQDIAPDEFARAVNVTFLGAVYGIKIALAYMKQQSHGHIIQIGSALAYRAIPLQAPYCASKFAIRAAVDSLRCELLHDRSPLHVTTINMPAMNTPQFDWARRHIAEMPQPVPPIYAPEACAKAVLWAAQHPDRREIWVGKPTFMAIFGNKFFPALMDWYMARGAFESQFERPSTQRDCPGNLFEPVGAYHKTEGRFSDLQRMNIFWFGTSWQHEIAMIAIIGLVILVWLMLVL